MKIRRWVISSLAAASLVLFDLEKPLAISREVGEDYAELKGEVEASGVVALEDSPNQDPAVKTEMTANLYRGSLFRFGSSLEFGYNGLVQGDNKGFGSMILDEDGYFDRKPYLDVDELFFDVFFPHATFRAGIQKIRWGVLDEIQPTDNLNPEDLSEFLIAEEEERKIGIPAFRWTHYFKGDWTTDLVWVPIFLPSRLGRPDSRWFPPLSFVETPGPITVTVGSSLKRIQPQVDYVDAKLGDSLSDRTEVGLRISKLIGSTNLSVSYFNGLDPRPVIDFQGLLDVSVPAGAAAIDDLDFGIRAELFPTHRRVQVFGGDLTTTIRSITLRMEGAYFKDRPYNKVPTIEQIEAEAQDPDPEEAFQALIDNNLSATFDLGISSLIIERDAVHYGLGIDYLRGTSLWSVQTLQEVILDHEPSLINKKWETIVTVIHQSTWLDENLEIRLAPAYNIEEETLFGFAKISYRLLPPLKATVGYILIDGDRNTLLGEYSSNDQVQLALTYQF